MASVKAIDAAIMALRGDGKHYVSLDKVLEYYGEHYPIRIESVGYRALYDPDNERVKS